ncbi:MAG: hypothetical protein ACFFAS_05905 [Promethearchaeota archaeon]
MSEINVKTTLDACILVPLNKTPLYQIISPDDEMFYSIELKAHFQGGNYTLDWKTPAIFSRKGVYFYLSDKQAKNLTPTFVPWNDVMDFFDPWILKFYLGKFKGLNQTIYYPQYPKNSTNADNDLKRMGYPYFFQRIKDYLDYLLAHKDDKEIYTPKKEKKTRKKITKWEKKYQKFLAE